MRLYTGGGLGVASVLEKLDNRFAPQEIVSASDLQARAIGSLQDRLKEHGKLLLTHYGKPVGVLVELHAYEALIQHLQNLQQRLEEAEYRRLVDERSATPEDEWVSTTPAGFGEMLRRATEAAGAPEDPR